MGKRIIRIITRIETDQEKSYDLGEIIRDQLPDGEEESREIVDILFSRDGLVGVNTNTGFRDQSCYLLKQVAAHDDKNINYGIVPYSKVALVTFREETFEEGKPCETPTTDLKMAEAKDER